MNGRRLAIASAMLLAVSLPVPAGSAGVLRVCADPDNLPFSSARAGERGLYVDLAELLASRLGMQVEYTWWLSYFGKRAVRNTLLSDRCDAYVGLPHDAGFMDARVTLSRPFLDVGYAVIGPPSFTFSRLADLAGHRVAVQFGAYPQLLLSARGDISVVTFRSTEDALAGLAQGAADAALVWGPTAGYHNKTKLGGRYTVVPVAGHGLQWHVAIGLRKGSDALRAAIDRELAPLAPEIRRLADAYGFPMARPVVLDEPGEAAPGPGPERPASGATPGTGIKGNPLTGDPGSIATGKTKFNIHCSHCHSPNAMSPEPSRDLRRLRLRYGDKMIHETFVTVTDGRPAKGMPPWKDMLPEDTIWQILSFLESVQRDP